MSLTEEAAAIEKLKMAAIVIPDDVAKLVDWIPRRRYMQLYGETEAVINNRIARKQWKKGEQYNVPEGGGVWISIKGVNRWAAAEAAAQKLKSCADST